VSVQFSVSRSKRTSTAVASVAESSRQKTVTAHVRNAVCFGLDACSQTVGTATHNGTLRTVGSRPSHAHVRISQPHLVAL